MSDTMFRGFTADEASGMMQAMLDYHLAPDNLSPRERSRQRLKDARYALRQAQAELDDALAYRDEVRRMSFAERNKRWVSKELPGPPTLEDVDRKQRELRAMARIYGAT